LGSTTNVCPCGAGIAWKRETWVGRPVAHAPRASDAVAAARVRNFLADVMILALLRRETQSIVR
jgi:hypothetical protein